MLSYKKTVFIGGIGASTSKEALERILIAFGPIKKIEIPLETVPSKTNKSLTRNRGFAYVEFLDEEDAEAAAANLHLSEFEERVLRVKMADKDVYKLSTGVPELHKLNEWYLAQLAEDGLRDQAEAIEYERNLLRHTL